jgi:hypothetical protein
MPVAGLNVYRSRVRAHAPQLRSHAFDESTAVPARSRKASASGRHNPDGAIPDVATRRVDCITGLSGRASDLIAK